MEISIQSQCVCKYNIYNVLQYYVDDCAFPSKYIWKHCIDTKVSNYYINEWKCKNNLTMGFWYLSADIT